MNTLLKTAESAVKTDKNGKNYKVIALKETGLIQTPWGLLPLPDSQGKETSITVYESNINGRMDAGYSEPVFNKNNPQAGGYFLGAIETRKTDPYTITGTEDQKDRTVDTATVIVLADNTSLGYEIAVQKAFRNKGRVLVTAFHTPIVEPVVVDRMAAHA